MFASEAEIQALRAAFDEATLARADWTHAAHVSVAATFVLEDPATALDRMRAGILRLNEAQGTANTETSGYHETLTVFWVAVVRAFCEQRVQLDRVALFNALTSSLPSGLWREFYSYDVVASHEARARWMAPDLKPLP